MVVGKQIHSVHVTDTKWLCLCVCMCVCLCVYMCACMHMCVCVCAYVRVFNQIHTLVVPLSLCTQGRFMDWGCILMSHLRQDRFCTLLAFLLLC